MPDENIFCVEDYRGKQVIFAKKKLEKKQSDHPELGKTAFLECVKNAIIDPDEVWQDYQDRDNRRCYYKKYSTVSYAKVVVWIKSNPCNVVTAYEIDRIQETKYLGLKRVK